MSIITKHYRLPGPLHLPALDVYRATATRADGGVMHALVHEPTDLVVTLRPHARTDYRLSIFRPRRSMHIGWGPPWQRPRVERREHDTALFFGPLGVMVSRSDDPNGTKIHLDIKLFVLGVAARGGGA